MTEYGKDVIEIYLNQLVEKGVINIEAYDDIMHLSNKLVKEYLKK